MFERYSPTIFLDKLFTEAVMAGGIVTLLGAGLLPLAAAESAAAIGSASSTSPITIACQVYSHPMPPRGPRRDSMP